MQHVGLSLLRLQMKTLIIGAGQIGQALKEIFEKKYETHIRDIEPLDLEGVEILHVAYPYSEHFIAITKAYIAQYKPRLTVIHSTVAVGVTEECGTHVLHSPERGRFPHLAKEMLAYKKFIAGYDIDDLDMAVQYFQKAGFRTQICDDPKITEKLKLISNAHMGLEIAWRQELERWGIDKEFYEWWEESYFQGYLYLNQSNLIRPRMRPDPIGGHCILQSIEILKEQFPSLLLDFVETSNELAKRKKEADERTSARAAEVSTLR